VRQVERDRERALSELQLSLRQRPTPLLRAVVMQLWPRT
jgi:hypothetical protein